MAHGGKTIFAGALGAVLFIMSCSTESPVDDLRSSNISDNDTAPEDECAPALSLLINESGMATYHSQQVQGVLMFCAGCHGQVNPQSGLDFSDYTRMVTSFSRQNILLSKILEQVQQDHQYSRESSLEPITAWHQNKYARGAKDGESDSPFFDGTSFDRGIDLEDFDPFGEQDLAPTAKNGVCVP